MEGARYPNGHLPTNYFAHQFLSLKHFVFTIIFRFCFDGSLDPSKVKGKLVYCMLAVYGAESVVKGIGGIGAIIGSAQFLDSAEIFMAPGTIVDDSVGNIIEDYIHSRR